MKLDAFQGRRALFGLASAIIFFTVEVGAVLAEPLPAREMPVPHRAVGRRQRPIERDLHQPRQPRVPPRERSALELDGTGEGSPVPVAGTLSILPSRSPTDFGTGVRFDFARPNDAPPIPGEPQLHVAHLGARIAPGPRGRSGLDRSTPIRTISFLDGPTRSRSPPRFAPRPTWGCRSWRAISTNRAPSGRTLGAQRRHRHCLRPTGRRSFKSGSRITTSMTRGSGSLAPPSASIFPTWGACGVTSPVPTRPPAASSSTRQRQGLEVGVGTATVEGGGVFGSGVGGSDGAGFYMGASFSGYRSPGIPEGAYALKVRIEETPGARRHVALLRRLWGLARDRQLKAVVLELKAEPADSLAHAEELGDAIRSFAPAARR